MRWTGITHATLLGERVPGVQGEAESVEGGCWKHHNFLVIIAASGASIDRGPGE